VSASFGFFGSHASSSTVEAATRSLLDIFGQEPHQDSAVVVISGSAAAGSALVLGDAVNVAARLEQAAAPAEVLIGQTTWQLVRDAVTAEPVAPLALKGKAAQVAAWRLLGVTPDIPGHARRRDVPLASLFRVGAERAGAG
jgi:class 3 adenylate cyclase